MLVYYSLHFQFTCSPIKGRKKSTFYKKISDYDDLEKMKVRKSGSDLRGEGNCKQKSGKTAAGVLVKIRERA